MNKTPIINGFYIGMPFEEGKKILQKMDYRLEPHDNHFILDVLDNKKDTDKPDLVVDFLNYELLYLYIYDWNRFFGFHNIMSYNNLIEILTNYSLKNYKYRTITAGYTDRIKLWGRDWDIEFIYKNETITYNWHRYCH